MIENLIRSASTRYYETVSKEKFVADLRRAGFIIHEVEEVSNTVLKGVYASGSTSFVSYPVSEVVSKQVSKKVESPEYTYRIAKNFSGSGEFKIGDAA